MRVVIALGGNAIENPGGKATYEQALLNVREACKQIVAIVERGYDVVITHGNGPQVGNLLIQQENSKNLVSPFPLDVLDAMTQGQIGYMIQRELFNMLAKLGIKKRVITIITQVLVDLKDKAFKNPTKPIGPFYPLDMEQELAKVGNFKRVIHEGKYYLRRVVPSPEPIRIIEGQAVSNLLDSGDIPIASGGGGIPVAFNPNGELVGVEAVIDKDLASERLAEAISADILLILTNVDSAKLNYGKRNEESIGTISSSEARKYIEEGHFQKGSMEPKILACVRFVEWGGRMGKITSLENALNALEGKAGTTVVR